MEPLAKLIRSRALVTGEPLGIDPIANSTIERRSDSLLPNTRPAVVTAKSPVA
jgi:hypothetical protein